VERRGGQGRVPEHLGIEVSVDVHEARGDDHAGGIDNRDRLVGDAADLDNMAVQHAYIGTASGCARSVDNMSAPNDHVQHGRPSPLACPDLRP
jgi:hypothetical protein